MEAPVPRWAHITLHAIKGAERAWSGDIARIVRKRGSPAASRKNLAVNVRAKPVAPTAPISLASRVLTAPQTGVFAMMTRSGGSCIRRRRLLGLAIAFSEDLRRNAPVIGHETRQVAERAPEIAIALEALGACNGRRFQHCDAPSSEPLYDVDILH